VDIFTPSSGILLFLIQKNVVIVFFLFFIFVKFFIEIPFQRAQALGSTAKID
jgi:hypothetical protein